jgi:hypothetical protein
MSKTIGFGGPKTSSTDRNPRGNTQGQAGGDTRGAGGGIPGAGFPGGGRGPGGGGEGRGGFGGGAGGSDKPYNLTFSINANNLLNRNNAGNPVGGLTSTLFGRSTSTGGSFGPFGGGGGNSANRRLELSMRFSW